MTQTLNRPLKRVNSRPIALLPIALLAAALCDASSPEQVIHLTKPEDIQHASTVDRAIVRLSDKVIECVQGKLAPAGECFCLYPKELAGVRNAYRGALRQHPDWKDKTVSYARDGLTYAVSLGGLDRQLQTKCPSRQ